MASKRAQDDPKNTVGNEEIESDSEFQSYTSVKSRCESEQHSDKSRKKSKLMDEWSTEDSKKQLFQRLFSEDDEIALVKGMLDYFAEKGGDPCLQWNAFYVFVKKLIDTQVTKAQVKDKIKRLKKKFENNAKKAKNGVDKTFKKTHEKHLFELSKKIWGKHGICGKVESLADTSNAKPNGNKSLGSLFDNNFGMASLEEQVLKYGLNMVDGEKKIAFEAKWRNFQIHELELVLKRHELIKDLAMSMLESYKSAKN